MEVDNCSLLRYVVTRWLSLLPAIDKILKCWELLKYYFQSLDEEECTKVLWKCFGDKEDAWVLSEIYFFFLSDSLKLFTEAIKGLEAKAFSITSVLKLLTELKSKLERRVKKEMSFDFAVNPKHGQLISEVSKKCEADFIFFYESHALFK